MTKAVILSWSVVRGPTRKLWLHHQFSSSDTGKRFIQNKLYISYVHPTEFTFSNYDICDLGRYVCLETSVGFHFKVVFISSLEYQPQATSLVSVSKVVTVFSINLVNLSCKGAGDQCYWMWEWPGLESNVSGGAGLKHGFFPNKISLSYPQASNFRAIAKRSSEFFHSSWSHWGTLRRPFIFSSQRRLNFALTWFFSLASLA